jgi:hypothetical protein
MLPCMSCLALPIAAPPPPRPLVPPSILPPYCAAVCVVCRQALSKRLSHLSSVGLLRQHQPESSQLMVTAANTLPDELLTMVQVS